MMLIALLFTLVSISLAGSPCPPRENIYPCVCRNIYQGKKIISTTISCHHLSSTDSLINIYPTLKLMTIDNFYIYDSFWKAKNLESGSEDKQLLPADWLTVLKVKEIEIVDTTLSSCFACNAKVPCRNTVTTRFTALNSSSHEEICTLCELQGKKYPWTGCMNKLRQFHFRHGKLTVLRADWFAQRMGQLTEFDLSHNMIADVQKNAFLNLPKLKILRLTHNALSSMTWVKGMELNELQELDVSWNQIDTLATDFIKAFPSLKTLVMNNNNIMKLKESDWKTVPTSTIRIIDLRENPIECDCDIRWINATFLVHTAIQGKCESPEEMEDTLIRPASRYLIERCTEDGKIGTRKRTTKLPATKAMYEV